MKRRMTFDEFISTRHTSRQKRLRISFSNKPFPKYWEIRHQVQQQQHYLRHTKPLSKLNEKALNTFTNFVHLENTSKDESIYILLLLDCLILKPSLFVHENFNGSYLSNFALAKTNDAILKGEIQDRLSKIITGSTGGVGSGGRPIFGTITCTIYCRIIT